MLQKLATSYSPEQEEYLRCVAYLDPVCKEKVDVDLDAFKTMVKDLYEKTTIILPTQNQELQNIETSTFTTPIASTTCSSSEGTPSQSQTLSTHDQMMMDLYTDDPTDEEVSDFSQLEEKN